MRILSGPNLVISWFCRIAVIPIVVLLGTLFLNACSNSNTTIVTTEYSPGPFFQWCENDSLVIGATDARLNKKGLLLLNASNPSQTQRFDLTNPLPVGPQVLVPGHFRCYGKRIILTASPHLTPESIRNGDNRWSLFMTDMGKKPELIASFKDISGGIGKGPIVHPKTNTIIANGWHLDARRTGVFDEFCANDIRPGYKVLCWDLGDFINLDQFVLMRYRWEDQIQITRGEVIRFIPNPNKPLVGPDGNVITDAYLLYDYDHNLVREVKLKTDKLVVAEAIPDPSGRYLYSPCHVLGDHDPKYTGDGRICRQKMDAQEQPWELLATIGAKGVVIGGMDINDIGDVVCNVVAEDGRQGIWKYDAEKKILQQLTKSFRDSDPKISPDGRRIAFTSGTSGKLSIIEIKN